jgi:hypothetical protein
VAGYVDAGNDNFKGVERGCVSQPMRGEAAKEGDVLVACITFNPKASLKTHGDVMLVESNGGLQATWRGPLCGFRSPF